MDYMFYTDRQVWALIEKMTEEQFNAPNDYSLGSVHEQVVHIMTVQDVWYGRIHGDQRTMQRAADFPTKEDIRRHWDTIEQLWRGYVERMTEDTLMEVVVAKTSRGEIFHERVWEIIMHLVNHSTDHRAQLLAAMHKVGAETMPQDWILYSRTIR
jgi:uncharacterized damage-inducible protein DinB